MTIQATEFAILDYSKISLESSPESDLRDLVRLVLLSHELGVAVCDQQRALQMLKEILPTLRKKYGQ